MSRVPRVKPHAAAIAAAAVALLCAAGPTRAQAQAHAETSPAALVEAQRCLDSLPAALSLTQAVRGLLCRAPELQRGMALQAQAAAQLRQAQARRRPELVAELRADGTAGWPSSRSLQWQAGWLLHDFGATRATLDAARQGGQAVRAERDEAVLQAIAQASTLYADALLAQRRHEAAGTTLRSASAAERQASARQQAGAGSLAEAVQAQRSLGQARLEFVRTEAARTQALLALAAALQWPDTQPLRLAADGALDEARRHAQGEPVEPGQTGPEDAPGTAAHPLVRAAQHRWQEAQARTEALRAERWGALRAEASLARQRPTDAPPAEARGALALAWRVPVLDGGTLRARIDEADAAAQAAHHTLDEARRRVRLARAQASAALAGELAALDAADTLTERAESAAHITGERWRNGVGSYTELLAAHEAASNARYLRAEAQASLLRARWQQVASGLDPAGLSALLTP